ncbi:unnamed protein product [Arctogadus glacialis]
MGDGTSSCRFTNRTFRTEGAPPVLKRAQLQCSDWLSPQRAQLQCSDWLSPQRAQVLIGYWEAPVHWVYWEVRLQSTGSTGRSGSSPLGLLGGQALVHWVYWEVRLQSTGRSSSTGLLNTAEPSNTQGPGRRTDAKTD